MRTVEIDEEVLEAMFDNVEYLHTLVQQVLALLNRTGNEEWLTSSDAAKILRVSEGTLLNMRSYGKIPYTKIHGRIMFRAKDVAAYILKCKCSNHND